MSGRKYLPKTLVENITSTYGLPTDVGQILEGTANIRVERQIGETGATQTVSELSHFRAVGKMSDGGNMYWDLEEYRSV